MSEELDLKCPVCGTPYVITKVWCNDPNSIYDITSCDHINLTRFCSVEDIKEYLVEVIREIRSAGMAR